MGAISGAAVENQMRSLPVDDVDQDGVTFEIHVEAVAQHGIVEKCGDLQGDVLIVGR